MPEFYTDTDGKELLVVSYDELVPRFYKTVRSLTTIVDRDMSRGYGLRKVIRGCRNRQALIDFDSLPARVRDEMDDPRRGVHPVDKHYKYDVAAESFYTGFMLPGGHRLSPESVFKYVVNASTIEALVSLKDERESLFARCGRTCPREWIRLLGDAKSFADVQQQKHGYRHSLPGSEKRFKEVVQEFVSCATIEESYKSLVSERHVSNSTGGARKVNAATFDLLESLFSKSGYKPNYTDVHDTYTRFLRGEVDIISNASGEILNPSSYKPVSESTIRAYLTRWESKNATLRLRTGDRQVLMSETKPYHSMRDTGYAGSILSVDDRQPPFEYTKGERVWFYLGYDLGADCYTTMVWGKDKKGIILDFYRQMVRNYAQWGLCLPAELEAESNLNSSYKDTFLREGAMFRYVRIEANNARGKKIENRNKAMRYGEERRSEGWIARPFAKDESNRAGVGKVEMLPYETIVEQTLQRYERWNNAPHPSRPEMSRWQFFMTHQHPNLTPINWIGIIPHLGYLTKSSCHAGIVRLNNGECLLGIDGHVALGGDLIKLMNLAEGEDLDIRWLDGNDGQVLKAYAYIGGQYVCELVRKPTYARARIEQTLEDLQARELMSSYAATIEGYGNRRKRSIDRVTVLDAGSGFTSADDTCYTTPRKVNVTAKERVAVQVMEDNDEEEQLFNGVERSFKRHLTVENY